MKIYRLLTIQVAPDPSYALTSSYNDPRTVKKEKFFLSMEKAQEEANLKHKAALELLGVQNDYEFRIKEIEVVE